jgi:CRP/FNR family transcriptional regulator
MPTEHQHLRTTAIIATLKQCGLFRDLPADILHEIAGFTVIKSLEKDEILFREGDKSLGFYVVQKGTINVHRVNALGKAQVIHLFRPGESFAEGTLATEIGYPADAQATEPSQLLLVRKADFAALVCQHPQLAMRMLASMSRHLRDLVGQIDDLQLKSVETRLANWLIKRCPDPESDETFLLTLPIGKRVLAQEIGTVGETLSRTLAKLRGDGLLGVDGKIVTIHSPAKLSALLRKHLGE